ncbi:MAG: ABC transporter permease [Armatimonadota bacterium]
MFRLVLAEFRRTWVLFLRYPLEAVTGIISLTAVFLALFLGVHYIAGPGAAYGGRLESVIVSYLLWSLTIFALGDMGWTIQIEAQTGTLEQVYLSPYGPRKVFLLRALSNLFMQLFMITVVFFIIKWFTHQHLSLSPAIAAPLACIMLGTYGMGFVLAGLTLLFKRIQNVLQLSQFVVLFLVAVPIENWQGTAGTLGLLIPLAPAAAMVREMMARGAAFNTEHFLYAFLNGVAYFTLGTLLFKYADRQAKRRGLLGGY